MKRFLTKCRKEILLFLLANFIWAGIGVSLAFILQYIMETAIQSNFSRLPIIIVLIILYLISDTYFEFSSNHTAMLLRTKISLLLRNALVRRIENCSIEEKEDLGDAHYLSLINNNVSEVEQVYIDGILMVIFQVFSLVFALIATTYIEPILTFITLLLCAVPLFVPRLLKNKLTKVNREALRARSSYLNLLNELLEGFLTLKIFNRLSEFNCYHDKKMKKL